MSKSKSLQCEDLSDKIGVANSIKIPWKVFYRFKEDLKEKFTDFDERVEIIDLVPAYDATLGDINAKMISECIFSKEFVEVLIRHYFAEDTVYVMSKRQFNNEQEVLEYFRKAVEEVRVVVIYDPYETDYLILH